MVKITLIAKKKLKSKTCSDHYYDRNFNSQLLYNLRHIKVTPSFVDIVSIHSNDQEYLALEMMAQCLRNKTLLF